MADFKIGTALKLEDLSPVIRGTAKLSLTQDAGERITKCRRFLEQKIKKQDTPIYGINTGFGDLCDKSIDLDDLEQLQHNLVISHAAATGDPLPDEIVRLMMVLKLEGLSKGYSGIKLATVERMMALYNHRCLPVVYRQGSLGASGDLAPLAHLALPLLGLGQVSLDGKLMPSSEALASLSLTPLQLGAKEGLALLNGTQFMSALGVFLLLKAGKLLDLANHCAALSLEGFNGRTDAFEPLTHQIRPHKGQQAVATSIIDLLNGSALSDKAGKAVQDPYSFRCVPQVHGASMDMMDYCKGVFETEINATTDNPNIFPDDDRIISGGNFHGQPLAIALDALCMALAELGSISERRTFKLLSGQRGLPEFLTATPGLHSGLMIAQYTAASMVSRNKQLSTPCCTDSIDSSNGQEDHVSMGANAALKTLDVVDNLEKILAIEWLCAAQAVHFRRPDKSSPLLEARLDKFRQIVPPIEEDRYLHETIEATINFVSNEWHI